jgi:F-type H+-transporting ATPase subunit gamma
MSSLKQIKDRISSIDKIVKITQAMEVVSLFRLKRIEKKAGLRQDYFSNLKGMVQGLLAGVNHLPHEFFALKKAENPLVLCIGSDKGLCGGFNLFVLNELASFRKRQDFKVIACGKRLGAAKRLFAAELLEFKDIQGLDRKELGAYVFSCLKKKEFDSFFIIYNQFKKNVLGRAARLQLLPLGQEKVKDKDFIFEGSSLWDSFFSTYIKEALEFAFMESACSEEFTRVLTMKKAKENAGELKDKVYLDFHKLRQSMITRELADITAALR